MLCAVRFWLTDTVTKQELRGLLKERRAAIPPEEKKKLDAQIVDRIAASDEFCHASAVLLYAPLAGEINLLPLVRLARAKGIPVAFPRCDTASQTMQFYILDPTARLQEGAYHIPEPPADAPLCNPDAHALCILPGLTFDLAGARLGYGKGYYDRFLTDFPGVRAGAVYEQVIVKRVPTEAHDISVSILFTDRSVHSCASAPIQAQTAMQKSAFSRASDAVRAKSISLIASLHQALNREKSSSVRALHAPPILVCTTFLLLLLSRLLDTHLTDRNNEYVVVILLQVLIFAIPAVVYGKLRGEAFSERIRMRLPRPEHLWYMVCILFVMISASMLCGILTGGISSLSGNFTLYDTFVARAGRGGAEMIYLLLAYCALPAFCEELVYRSILCAEYERFGVAVSILVSALFFSMLHFSFPLFFTYFVLGILLAGAMYTTRSFFTAFALHLLYNVFCLFGQPYLSAFYVYAGSHEIFIFCLVVILLLFGAFAAGEARKIYHRYARANLDSSYTVPIAAKEIPLRLLRALLSPATALALVIWLVMAILKSL